MRLHGYVKGRCCARQVKKYRTAQNHVTENSNVKRFLTHLRWIDLNIQLFCDLENLLAKKLIFFIVTAPKKCSQETLDVHLKKTLRLCNFALLSKWFAKPLSLSACLTVSSNIWMDNLVSPYCNVWCIQHVLLFIFVLKKLTE